MGGWALIVVAPIELALVGLLVAGVDVPVPLRLVVGLLLAGALLYELARCVRQYRRRRRSGADRPSAVRAAAADLLPAPVRTAMGWEWQVWRGLVRGALRRPDIPTGATAFTHHRALSPVRWTLIGLLVVEIGVVHLLVPAGGLRVALLLIGLYGLVWIAGYLLGSGPVRPHLVDGNRVVLRTGLTGNLVVPMDAIAQARAVHQGRLGMASVQVDGAVLHLVDNGGTSLELVLRAPIALPQRDGDEVGTIRVWVDDPRAMAAEIERRASVEPVP